MAELDVWIQFAAAAMQGELAAQSDEEFYSATSSDALASIAASHADALLVEYKKRVNADLGDEG